MIQHGGTDSLWSASAHSVYCSSCPKGSLDSHVAPGQWSLPRRLTQRCDSDAHSYRPMRRMTTSLAQCVIVRPLTWASPRQYKRSALASPFRFFLSIHNRNPLRKLTDHELASSRSSLRNHLQLPTSQSSNHPQPNHLNQHKWIPSWR